MGYNPTDEPALPGRVTPHGSPPVPRLQWRQRGKLSAKDKETTEGNRNMNLIEPMFVIGAIGYSVLYLVFGGGLGGAVLIFIVAKMLGK